MKTSRNPLAWLVVMLGALLLGGGMAQAEEVEIPWMGENGWMQWHPHRSGYTLALVGTQTYFGKGVQVGVTRSVAVAPPPAPAAKAEVSRPADPPKLVEVPKPAEVTKERCPGTPKGVKLTPQGCWDIEIINFDFDKSKIRKDEEPGLKDVAKVMKENAKIVLEVKGHTDNRGPDAYNQLLSERRAKAVSDYLIGQGVDKHRLKNSGYSFSRPVATNDTSAGRALNRRVELTPNY